MQNLCQILNSMQIRTPFEVSVIRKILKIENLELFTESYGEPVNDLNDWDKTDSKTEPTHTADAGDEVEPGHLGRPLKL